MFAPSVDVYTTYRCNLRCTHCFVGDNLETSHDFAYDSLVSLIQASAAWHSEEITFLGGEPTLYPRIVDAVKLTQTLGMRARLVTNGLHGFRAFIDHFDGSELPIIGFSIDGSGPAIHDAIRGPRSFERMMVNIDRARDLGYQGFAITSVSRANADDLREILELCNRLQFSHVNIHYVTNRGFATEEMVLSVPHWQAICRDVQEQSAGLALDVRLERTFAKSEDHRGSCAVRDRSNLMFLPDGRVFMCPMFIDVPDAHSFTWASDGLRDRRSDQGEDAICSSTVPTHCPAMPLVNPKLNAIVETRGLQVVCVLEKTRLRRGLTVADS